MPTSSETSLRIAVTCGEPAGIGPDIVLALATHDWPVELVIFGDRAVLAERAAVTGHPPQFIDYRPAAPARASRSGELTIADEAVAVPSRAGILEPRNATHVLSMLRRAAHGCLSGEFSAMVTAPVNKAVINDSGTAFSGHTEFLAELCQAPLPVMLLTTPGLRVALLTTHLPLRAVPDQVTAPLLEQTLRILAAELERLFGLPQAHIMVLGLNPHAGESGHLGHEDATIIAPVLAALNAQGLKLSGPVPADTAFTAAGLKGVDAVLAMYHDQGLPVLKARGFGQAVNVTLGLPIIRTSVDHGTALSLAGSGRADPASLLAAVREAIAMAGRLQA